jgi:DNA-binding transcriptional ArsR family regulator
MVESNLKLNLVFASLADPTRRDILQRVTKKQLSVKEIAQNYKMSFAGISKHLMVMQKAGLIVKKRQGKEQLIMANPKTIKSADDYLKHYEAIWIQRFDRLEELLKKEKEQMIKRLK